MAFRFFKFREQENNPELVKPFLDHLEDLRWMLIKMIGTVAVTSVLSFAFIGPVMSFLQRPLASVRDQGMVTLMAIGVAAPMTVSISVSFCAGVVLAFPILVYQLAAFVIPALTKQERRYVYPLVGTCFALFMVGVLFCFYYVLPVTLQFFAGYANRLGMRPNWTIDQYFSFVTNFVLAFGLSFELPVLVIALVKLGLVEYQTLARSRSYAIVGILVAALVIAPPELLTMLSMAAPMYLLYEISVQIARWMTARDRKKAAALEAERDRLAAELVRQREQQEAQRRDPALRE